MKQLNNEIRQFYNQAGVYFSKTRAWVWTDMAEAASKIKPGERVLDLGCGNGRLVKALKPGVEYWGVDFSSVLIKEAKKTHQGSKTHFVRGNILNEKTWDALKNNFTAVFCVAVLHHIGERQQQLWLLRKIKSRLKKTGWIYLTIWNLWQKRYLKHHFSWRSLKLKKQNWRFLYLPFQKKYWRFCVAFNQSYLKKLFREAGWGKIKIYSAKGNICVLGSNTGLLTSSFS